MPGIAVVARQRQQAPVLRMLATGEGAPGRGERGSGKGGFGVAVVAMRRQHAKYSRW